MAHIHEKVDWTVSVFIVHKNKVLIRKHDKYDIWLGVGGHVELDEDPIQAGKRECLEEVGLSIAMYGEDTYRTEDDERQNIPCPTFMNRHFVSDVHEHLDCIYFATSDTDAVVPENPTDTWLWLTKEEVQSNPEISTTIKKYATAALDVLGQV